MRYPILDGFRGFFLIAMVVVHANEWLNTTIGKLNHHYFGWVEDAQGFILISGLVVGLVYGKILDTRGLQATWRAVGKRCREIYIHHAVVGLLFLALAVTGIVQASPLKPYIEFPLVTILGELTLVSATMHMEILPMYLYFMALTPLVLVALQKGQLPAVAVVSAGSWLTAQMGIPALVAGYIQNSLSIPGFKLSLFFDLFAWQAIYFLGLVIGYRLSRGEPTFELLRTPTARPAAIFAFAMVLVLGIFDRAVNDDWISRSYSTLILNENLRQEFGPLFLLAFMADLFVVAWMLSAGIDDRSPAIRVPSQMMRWLFTRKPLVFLGQHSLTVFAFHLPVVYLISALFPTPPSQLLGSAVLIGCGASLYVPAWIHSRTQRRKFQAAKPELKRAA